MEVKKPEIKFGVHYPSTTKEKVKWIMKNYPDVYNDKTSNMLVCYYWKIFNDWGGKVKIVKNCTPIETITRARREAKL